VLICEKILKKKEFECSGAVVPPPATAPKNASHSEKTTAEEWDLQSFSL